MQYFANNNKSIRCFDLSARVNVHNLRPDFHRLRQGAAVGMYKVDAHEATIVPGPSESIYQDMELLPGAGRVAVQRALQFFVFQNCPHASHVYIKAQRSLCPGGPGAVAKVYALTDHGTMHNFQHIGIMCVGRENVIGGSLRWHNGEFLQLRPGDMVFYDTETAKLEEVTHILSQDGEGYVDFLLFFGNC